MDIIRVKASSPYNVYTGPGLLAKTGAFLSDAPGSCSGSCKAESCTVAIVSDSNVDPLYRKTVETSLKNAGFRVVSRVFPAGESHKSLDSYAALVHFLSENHLTRTDYLAALGGGVTGDLTGFAAATYLRGVPYIHLPTTLLAAVDSSVGGKTAINLPCGKNLAGAFYQPSLVVCDTDCLKTLPRPVLCDGFAEIIKYAMICGGKLMQLLKQAGESVMDACLAPPDQGDAPADASADILSDIIGECVRIKASLVEADEFDRGARRLLNFGHTFGHAIEAAGGYTISHGQCVAAGMAIMTRAAVKKGFCPAETLDTLLSLLSKFELPSSINDIMCKAAADLRMNGISGISAADLCEIALSDKKNSGGMLHLVVPAGTGTCTILPVPENELTDWLIAGGVA